MNGFLGLMNLKFALNANHPTGTERDNGKCLYKMLEVNAIYQGDARDLLKEIRPDSIALSVWSPPYHVGKDYEKDQSYEEWLGLLREVIHLHFRILKPGGFLAINIADILCFKDKNMPKFQAAIPSIRKIDISCEEILAAKKKHPSYSRYQLAELMGCSEQTIQRRLYGNTVRGGKYQTQTRVKLVGGLLEEYALEVGLYLYDRKIWVKDAAWQSCRWTTLSYKSVDEFEHIFLFWKPGTTIINREKLSVKEWTEWGSRGVWKFPSVRNNHDHEAKFPVELPKRLIILLTEPGDIILDPFMGSGTTAVAAIQTGRKYIGIDKEKKYVELSQKNIKEARSKLSLQSFLDT